MASKPGKIAPRLLQDLLTYDARYEERAGRNLLTSAPPHHDPDSTPVPAVPFRNCRHQLFNKDEQSQLPRVSEDPDHTTVYKVASFCSNCRWHFDVVVDFRDDGLKNDPCRTSNRDYPLHHFVLRGDDGQDIENSIGSQTKPRTFSFSCSAPICPVALRIRITPPRFNDADVSILTNRAHLRKRWEAAKQLAGERADTSMARPVDAPDFLNTYLQDSLNPQKGKSQIPFLNRKFLKTFGRDCDGILRRLGFTSSVEEEEDGSSVEVWHLPKPPPATHPLENTEPTARNIIEDARWELNTIIMSYSEPERFGARHVPRYPTPSRGDLERALGCHDYEKWKGRTETRSTNREEDHPYYAGLGAVGDFADRLLLFAYQRQSAVDVENAAYYFECLQGISVGRNSEMLQNEVAMLASQGAFSRSEVASAYRYFGIQLEHVSLIGDEHIIGVFKSRLADISPSLIEETRRQLRIIGEARNSNKIRHVASDAIETYEQALSWLDLDKDQPDDYVPVMYGIKTSDSPSSIDTAKKAVKIIADHRNSQRLHDFLEKGSMEAPEMDVAEAYAILSLDNRAAQLDMNVLQEHVNIMIDQTPESRQRYQEAFAKVRGDQEASHGKSADYHGSRKHYPLAEWPVGACNIGNTCYLNSVLQYLFTVKPLRELVLNCEAHMQELSPEALKTKQVGRTAVSSEKVVTAQKFVRELRDLFEQMINAPEPTVRPTQSLAGLALSKGDALESVPIQTDSDAPHEGLGELGGLPVIGPMLPPGSGKDSKPASPADSVMGDDNDADSMAAMDLTGSYSAEPNGTTTTMPKPPSRPPPVPPRPQAANDGAFKKIEGLAQQQDAAEILNNIFDLLSCAIKGEGTLRDHEQSDLIKELFFSDVTTVFQGEAEATSALQDNLHVSTNHRDRSLCAALDDEFSLTELENGTTKYEYIAKASPIQIINVRRLQFEENRIQKDDSHLSLEKVLYLDRYLQETKSLKEDQLQELRLEQWEKQRDLRNMEARRKRVKETQFKDVDMPDVLDEAARFIEDVSKPEDEEFPDLVHVHAETSPELPSQLTLRADQLRKEIEAMEAQMKGLEKEIDSVFENCKDHPYRLHAVFMHRGTAHGGHYWIYIYDFQADMWRKYNDEYVDDVTEEEVFRKEASNPATSTGIIYVRDDVVGQYTQAVCRKPTRRDNDIEMKDVDTNGVPVMNMDQEWTNLEVLTGVEKE